MKSKRFLAIFLVLALLLSGCANGAAGSNSPEDDQIVTNRYPEQNATVSLTTPEIEEFLTGYTWAKGSLYLDKAVPSIQKVTFSWECETENTGYTLVYATNPELTDPVKVDTLKAEVTVSDLFVATTYYWQVITHTAQGDDLSSIYSFTTAQTPRFITIEGVENTRDIGGYLTEDGTNRVKQGMVFRGERLESATDMGLVNAMENYKIKTELDLRYSKIDKDFVSLGSSFLGKDVNYINLPGMQYLEALSNPKEMNDLLSVFAETENYPIYVHCSAGKDRTGTLIFILGALLGVSEEDLCIDFELTHVVKDGYDMYGYDGMNNLLPGFKAIEGDTLKEKAENFCKSIGLTDDQIQAIRTNLLEEVK